MLSDLLNVQRHSVEAMRVVGLGELLLLATSYFLSIPAVDLLNYAYMFSAVVNLVYNNTPGSTQLCTKTFSDSIISTLEEHHADSKVTEHMVRTIATMLFLVPPSARKLFASQRVATLLIRTLNVHQLKFSLLEQALCGLYHITLVQCVAVKLRNSEESCTILRDCIEHMVLHLQFWLCV